VRRQNLARSFYPQVTAVEPVIFVEFVEKDFERRTRREMAMQFMDGQSLPFAPSRPCDSVLDEFRALDAVEVPKKLLVVTHNCDFNIAMVARLAAKEHVNCPSSGNPVTAFESFQK
jgi:hypothetical protein